MIYSDMVVSCLHGFVLNYAICIQTPECTLQVMHFLEEKNVRAVFSSSWCWGRKNKLACSLVVNICRFINSVRITAQGIKVRS
jgi:hypothetical protein